MSDVKTLERYNSHLQFIENFGDFQLAYRLAETLTRLLRLQPQLETENPPLFQSYVAIVRRCRWVALPLYDRNIIVPLFKNAFLLTYQIFGYDVKEKVRQKLETIILIPDREKLKKEIIEALRENTEVVTEETVTKDGKEQPGSIKNWLLDETIVLGLNPVAPVNLANYLVGSDNTRRLSKKSREKLQVLFELTERLKIPSDTPAGYESAAPVDLPDIIGTIREGTLINYKNEFERSQKSIAVISEALDKIDLQATNAPTAIPGPITGAGTGRKQLGVENLLKIYSQNPDEQKAIYEEEKSILKRVGQEQLNIRPEFEEAVRGNNRNRVIAFLHVMAKTQDLAMVMKTDGVFRDYLKEKYGPESLTQFDVQPADPVFYSLWLQYLLKQRLQMLESDSARIGTKLANLLGRKYLKVAYIDSVTGSFKWVPVKKEKNRLTLVT